MCRFHMLAHVTQSYVTPFLVGANTVLGTLRGIVGVIYSDSHSDDNQNHVCYVSLGERAKVRVFDTFGDD